MKYFGSFKTQFSDFEATLSSFDPTSNQNYFGTKSDDDENRIFTLEEAVTTFKEELLDMKFSLLSDEKNRH